MNKILIFTLLSLASILYVSCSEDNEPEYGLFHLTLGMEGGADVAMGNHDVEITINGYAKDIDVGIVGDFDSFTISDGLPSWLTVETYQENKFFIHVYALSGSESRVGKVGFTVFKGSQSQAGCITITQNALTYEDLRNTERKAIKSYLSKFDVYDKVPPIDEIQVGSVAPFYKLDADGEVYMQVVRMGTGKPATNGETIYFRFLRYNLLYYFEHGVLPNGVGNATDINAGATSFKLGSDKPATTRWGTAIQMPMLLGLPIDSEVNLVVASVTGPTEEISDVIPYLYNIKYYPSTM